MPRAPLALSLLAALGLTCPLAAQGIRLDPAAFNRPIRVAVVGDGAVQGNTGAPPLGGGRGAAAFGLRGGFPAQQAAVAALPAAYAAQAQAMRDAKAALDAASVAFPSDAEVIRQRAEALRAADLALALVRADALARIQSSTDRLDPDQLPLVVQQILAADGGGAARGGGRGGAAAEPPGVRPPVDFPSLAGAMLGDRWDVRNFGVNGTTVLKLGDLSYWRHPALDAALEFNPDIVLFMFGASDSRQRNWRFSADFVPDYKALIARFASLPSRPRIALAKPLPGFLVSSGVDGRVVAEQIGPQLDQIARDTGGVVVDLGQVALGQASLVPDGIIPNPAGSRMLAEKMFTALTGRPAPPAAP